MRTRSPLRAASVLLLGLALSGCGAAPAPALPVSPAPAASPSATAEAPPSPAAPRTGATRSSAAPRPSRTAARTAAGPGAVDTTRPDRVVGTGTPASCTSAAVVSAVAAGGVITFDCGPEPVVIAMTATAKVRNTSARVVLDGGGRVTLSGGGRHRILYQNTCDQAQVWTTSHCNDQAQPALTLQRMAFTGGNATGEDPDGGGAVFVRGEQLAIVGSRFADNRCDASGPDVGGAAVRVLDQFQDRPVTVSGSTFTGGACSNGGALSSIGVSWTITDSVFTGNRAIGSGANPARAGTPGGGSGGAIYTDGNRYDVTLTGSRIQGNDAVEGGGAIFFVSNDRTGSLALRSTTLANNPSHGFETAGHPGIFFLGARLS